MAQRHARADIDRSAEAGDAQGLALQLLAFSISGRAISFGLRVSTSSR